MKPEDRHEPWGESAFRALYATVLRHYCRKCGQFLRGTTKDGRCPGVRGTKKPKTELTNDS